MSWDNAKKGALKILGDGAEVPDIADGITKAVASWDKAKEAFKTSRDACEQALLDLDNANSAVINNLQQFRAKIEKNNFSLDDKKDAKKIQQAQKLLVPVLDENIKAYKVIDKTIDELERHLAQTSKYKPSSTPI